MQLTIVKISAWFSVIFYLIVAFVSLIILFTEKIEYSIIATFFVFALMSATGWNARKFGPANFKINKYSKTLAALTLIFGMFFLYLRQLFLLLYLVLGNLILRY